MKKFFSLVLALVMALSLTTVAWGAPALDSYDPATGVATVYDLTLTPTPSDPNSHGTITVSDKDGLLKLPTLVSEWAALFSDGTGTTYTNYANGKGADYYYDWTWKIVLTADIDFGGATIDPINLGKKLVFDGQGHTIKNAVIVTDSTTENEAGLFNGAQCGFTNLKLDNIQVTGSNVGNSCVGVLSGSCNKAISNVTVTNSSAINGKYTGGVVGYGYTDITGCALANVTVKGGYKMGGLIGYICASGSNTGDVTSNSLTGCTVEGCGTFAGGKDKYVVGMLVGNYNTDGDCGANTITNMTTSATGMVGETETGKTVGQLDSNAVPGYNVVNGSVVNNAGQFVGSSSALTSSKATYGTTLAAALANKTETVEVKTGLAASASLKTFETYQVFVTTTATGTVSVLPNQYVLVPTAANADIVVVDGSQIVYLMRVPGTAYTDTAKAVKVAFNAKPACGDVYVEAPANAGTYYLYKGEYYVESIGGTLFNVDGMAVYATKTNLVKTLAHTYDYDAKAVTGGKTVVTSVFCSECKQVFDFVEGDVADAVKAFGAGNYADTGLNNVKDIYVRTAATVVGTVVTPSTDKVTSAETFDAGIAMYVGMSVMAAAGSAVVIGKKKD